LDQDHHGGRLCWLNGAATGVGKTYITAHVLADSGLRAIWLAPRHDLLDEIEELLVKLNVRVGRVPRLDEQTCLCPGLIDALRARGYDYRALWCAKRCSMMSLHGRPSCEFLLGFQGLESADVLLAPSIFHERGASFYSRYGNASRPLVIVDEEVV
jgi:hypothetical protein